MLDSRVVSHKQSVICEAPTESARAEGCSLSGKVDETLDPQVEDTHEWIPAEEPITDHTFLLNSKIWEICNQMPIHWMHPSAKKGRPTCIVSS